MRTQTEKLFFFNQGRAESFSRSYDRREVNKKIRNAQGKLNIAKRQNNSFAQDYQNIRLAQLFHVHCKHNPQDRYYAIQQRNILSTCLEKNIPAAYMQASRIMRYRADNPLYPSITQPMLNRHNLFTEEQAMVKAAYWGDVDAVNILFNVLRNHDKNERDKTIVMEFHGMGYDICCDVMYGLHKLRKNFFALQDDNIHVNMAARDERTLLVKEFQEMSVFTLDKDFPVGTMKKVDDKQNYLAPSL